MTFSHFISFHNYNYLVIGVTSENLDRVLHEAFRLNASLFYSCKLVYASVPLHSTTVEALAETLSNADVDDHETTITKTMFDTPDHNGSVKLKKTGNVSDSTCTFFAATSSSSSSSMGSIFVSSSG